MHLVRPLLVPGPRFPSLQLGAGLGSGAPDDGAAGELGPVPEIEAGGWVRDWACTSGTGLGQRDGSSSSQHRGT